MRLFSAKTVGLGLLLTVCFLLGCQQQEEQSSQQIPEEETVFIHDITITTGQTLFVPAYSEVHYAGKDITMQLAVTLTIHNTDFTSPVIVTSARYYNSKGKVVKEYLPKPQRLGPMASADFFVDSSEQTNGVGTHFIVEWVAEQPVYEPVVETLMLSNSGTQGLSFTSAGRVIKHIESSPHPHHPDRLGQGNKL
ncbi:MAG: DUF3124 domain-containing protein [Candidatus Electrothrix sp. AUS3]|nr:DUF3124 domain-containing protein [Candidatus Electrothrix gigas]